MLVNNVFDIIGVKFGYIIYFNIYIYFKNYIKVNF